MPNQVNPIPPGFHSVTPALIIRGAAGAIEFYKKAFGAKENGRMAGPDGKIMHADLQIGDSHIMMCDEFPQCARSPQTLGGTSVGLYVYVNDVDATFKQAVAAGAKVIQPVVDQFWGDRWCSLEDPYGHGWQIATHKENVPPDEMRTRAAKMFAKA
jgi:PhnB protein